MPRIYRRDNQDQVTNPEFNENANSIEMEEGEDDTYSHFDEDEPREIIANEVDETSEGEYFNRDYVIGETNREPLSCLSSQDVIKLCSLIESGMCLSAAERIMEAFDPNNGILRSFVKRCFLYREIEKS